MRMFARLLPLLIAAVAAGTPALSAQPGRVIGLADCSFQADPVEYLARQARARQETSQRAERLAKDLAARSRRLAG